MEGMIKYIIIGVVFLLALPVLRETICWFLRINRLASLLEHINANLSSINNYFYNIEARKDEE